MLSMKWTLGPKSGKCSLADIFKCEDHDKIDFMLSCGHTAHSDCFVSFLQTKIQSAQQEPGANSHHSNWIVCPQCQTSKLPCSCSSCQHHSHSQAGHIVANTEVKTLIGKSGFNCKNYEAFCMIQAKNTVVEANDIVTAHEKLVTCVACEGMYLVDTSSTSFVTCANPTCNTRFCVDVSDATVSYYLLLL